MKYPYLLKPLYFGSAIAASITPILYWVVDKRFSHVNKFFFYSIIGLMLLTLLSKQFILNDRLVKFIFIYSAFIVVLGLLLNPIGKASLAHLQPLFLPIIGFSFGYFVAKYYGHTLNKIYSGAFSLGVVLSIIIVIYYLLYKAGYIPYFGASSLMFIPIIWALLEKKWFYFLVFTVALVLTGKRSGLLAVLVIFIFGMYQTIGAKRFFLLLGAGAILLTFVVMFNNDSFPVFKRFSPLVEALSQSEMSLQELNMATSGRINDAVGAFNSINSNWVFWVFGKGIGATFEVETSNDIWITHYTHFTPLSYIFLGGVILFVAIYSKIFSLLWFSIKNSHNFFNLLFINYFVTSILGGAIYFTNPFVWIFAGVVIFNKKFNIRHAGNMY